jgi:hypothetical protein
LVWFLTVLLAVGCKGYFTPLIHPSANTSTPDEQWKEIAATMQNKLRQFFNDKGTRLSAFRATRAEETDAQKKIDFPYLARIEFTYPATKPAGEPKTQTLHTGVAEYRFSKGYDRWVLQTCSLKQDGGPPEKENLLVDFSEIEKVFGYR